MDERCGEGCRSGQMGDGHLYCPTPVGIGSAGVMVSGVIVTVQYPAGVCEGHEYGSEWPCTGCGK